MSRIYIGPHGGAIAMPHGGIQESGTGNGCCCDGLPPDCCPTVCPHWLAFFGSADLYVRADGGPTLSEEFAVHENDDEEEPFVIQTFSIRGKCEGLVTVDCGGDFGRVGSYGVQSVEALGPGGWEAIDTEHSNLFTYRQAGVGVFPDPGFYANADNNLFGGWTSLVDCLEGNTATGGLYFDGSITFVSRSCDSEFDSDWCDMPCAPCSICTDGPSELDVTLTVSGSPVVLGGYQESDSPCTYLIDVVSDVYYGSLYYEAAGDDGYGTIRGDRYRLTMYFSADSSLAFDGFLECSGEGDQQMLGTFTKLAGDATVTAAVTA